MAESPTFIKQGGMRYFHQDAVNHYFGIIAQLPHPFVGLRQLMGEQVAFSDDELESRRAKLEGNLRGLEELIGPEIRRVWNLHPASGEVPGIKILRDGVYYKEDALKQLLESYTSFADMESARHRTQKQRAHPDWQRSSVPEHQERQTQIDEKIASITLNLNSLQTMPVEVVQLAGNYVAKVEVYLASLKAGIPQHVAATVTAVIRDNAPIAPS